ncbi:SDR family oxidoreductase [Neobacillus niacini]|uniref:SDR family NAD(P)-dependent oxidoreductase n=1 Tax=Neobacillus niacini TaxID=86668 RepID=UPI003003582B
MSEKTLVELVAEARGESPGRGRLVGKRILVIGGGQTSYGEKDEPHGNGRAMSILFGREGASVVVADRNLQSAEETVRFVSEEGATAYAIAGDASNESDVKNIIQRSCDILGGLDGLVLNVGIEQGRLFENTSVEQWDTVFAVNVRSQFLAIKYGLPVMEPGSSIVLISSTGAFSTSVQAPAYSASKSALAGICNNAAREGSAKHIRCNIVAPGKLDTPMGRNGGKNRASRESIPTPLGRDGTAWDTAYMVNFLLSNESTYITGQTMIVDGGRMLS